MIFFVLALLIPPAAVYLKKGMNSDFALNILLTLLFYFPGMLHAFYIVINEHRY